MDLKNQVAIITGAGLGMGRAIAVKLAACGAAVLVSDKNEESALETVRIIEQAGGTAIAVKADVALVPDIINMFDVCEAKLGKADILVANAGVSFKCPITEVTEEFYQTVYDINAKGTLFSLKEAGLRLNDGGRIVVISSCSARFPEVGMAAYSSSKAATQLMVEVAALEFAARGITVNSIQPGLTGTETMLKYAPAPFVQSCAERTPLGRLGMPEDIAEVAAFLCSKESQWVSGQHILASGGLMAPN